MYARLARLVFLILIALPFAQAHANEYSDTIKVFRNAGESGKYFAKSYGYAVFPTIAKGGFVIGAAHGSGRVYRRGRYVGDSSMTQVTVGAQFGGEAYSEIVFFEDRRSFEKFTSGNFEFGAQASAVAITAGASAQAGSMGASAGASISQHSATTAAKYYKGTAVFTVTKGGLMYAATIGGQKFSYKPRR